MKFPANWYVPILKSKPGEMRALSQLRAGGSRTITPVIEIVQMVPDDEDEEDREQARAKAPQASLFPSLRRTPPARPSLEDHIRAKMAGITDALGGELTYIDPHEVAEIDRAVGDGADIAFRIASELGLKFIPVIGIDRADREVRAAHAHTEHGLAIRVTATDVGQPYASLARGAIEILRVAGLDWEQVDVILDAEDVPPTSTGQDNKARMMLEFCGALPFRNLIFAGSAMPRSLPPRPPSEDGQPPQRTEDLIPRHEWALWRRIRRNAERAIIYGDHGIQHPAGVEKAKGKKGPLPPIAIRFATPETWLVLRGPPRHTGVQPREEYPVLAEALTNRPEFQTVFHCAGCKEIVLCAQHQLTDAGQPSAWRRIGTSHHIATVTQQLARERTS